MYPWSNEQVVMEKTPPPLLTTMSAAANTIPTNALSKCVASIQADMKLRIEEECRKQMLGLLEDSFTQKWDEYTNEVTKKQASLYSQQYGRLYLNNIPNNDVWGACPEAKTVLSKLQTMYVFSSKNVYLIHCCISLSFHAPRWYMTGYFIDNYGFPHMVRADIISSRMNGGYPDKPVKIDVMESGGEKRYVYPLSNALIDMIKTIPMDAGKNMTSGGEDTERDAIIKILASIRKASAIFYDQTVALDALREENEMLKEQLQKNTSSASVLQQVDNLFDSLFASSNTEPIAPSKKSDNQNQDRSISPMNILERVSCHAASAISAVSAASSLKSMIMKPISTKQDEWTCENDGKFHEWIWEGKKYLRDFQDRTFRYNELNEYTADDWMGLWIREELRFDRTVPYPKEYEENE
jgi:hypothetical protein